MKYKIPRYTWQSYNFGSISLCMIMRNSAGTLKRCLDSIKNIVSEIIIVDTGSTDASVEIARACGAQILFDAWQDDFARPRNIGIEKATKDWILVLDPDEVIMPYDLRKIQVHTQDRHYVAFWITTRNYNMARSDLGFRTINRASDPMGKYEGFVPSTKTRLFKNGLGIRFEGCWHELVDWYLFRNKLPTGNSDVVVHHWAHEFTQESARAKVLFSLKMGEKKVKEMPTFGQAWWELAVAESIIGYRYRAAQSLAKAFSLGFGNQSQYFHLARLLHLIGDEQKSTLAFEKGICKLFPTLTHINTNLKNDETLLRPLL